MRRPCGGWQRFSLKVCISNKIMLPIAILLKDNHSNKALLALSPSLFFCKEKDAHVYTVWFCCLFSPLTLFKGHLPSSYMLGVFFGCIESLLLCVSFL